MVIDAISYSPFRPAEPEKSHTWSWAVGDQKQELRELEETLEIENMEMEEVLFRYPIGEDNLVVEASRGLGELSIGQHDDETAVHKRTCHLAETESLFLTKGDYMGTRRYRDCSDRQLMFWWHWYVRGEGNPGMLLAEIHQLIILRGVGCWVGREQDETENGWFGSRLLQYIGIQKYSGKGRRSERGVGKAGKDSGCVLEKIDLCARYVR